MKIRTDFVSNSSSSSFILQNSPLFDFFNVTKLDLAKALLLVRDEAPTEANLAKHLGKTFWIYDLSKEEDYDKAIAEWSDTLKEWTATHVCRDRQNELIAVENSHKADFEAMLEAVNNIWGTRFYSSSDVPSSMKDAEAKRETRWERFDKKINSEYGKDVPLEQYVLKMLIETKKRVGIMSNLDVLQSGYSRFFVHYDDNEIWEGEQILWPRKDDEPEQYHSLEESQGFKLTPEQLLESNMEVSDYNNKIKVSPYTSDMDTEDRFMEVLFAALCKLDIIKPTDVEFLKKFAEAEKRPSAPLKDYTTENFKLEVLTFTGHEG